MKYLAFLLFVAVLLTSAQASEQTRQVQAALKDSGFYYGEVDGAENADTTASLRRYQIRNGLEVTGTVTAETLASLKIGGSAAATETPLPERITAPPLDESTPLERPPVVSPPAVHRPPPAGPIPPKQVEVVAPGEKGAAALQRFFIGTPFADAPREEQSVRLAKAQSQLRRLGYYSGAPDGLPGPSSEEALLRFQSANGLRLTSRLDEATTDALNAVAAATAGKRVRVVPGPALKGVWVH